MRKEEFWQLIAAARNQALNIRRNDPEIEELLAGPA